MIHRRDFITLLGGAAATCRLTPGLAQTPPKRPLIGFLAGGSKAANARYYSGFLQGMRELGYVEGRDYVFEDRYADGDLVRLPALAQELVQLKPDVIVTTTTSAAVAAKQATTSIPIVCTSMQDPVRLGLVASEARPATNVTGMLTRVDGMPGKQLEIARDVMPGIGKIGALINSDGPTAMAQLREMEAAAAKLAVSLVPVEIRAATEIGSAFQTFVRERTNIVVIFGNPMFLTARRQIAAYALASHLPTVYGYREHVEDGGLISYGINLRESFRRAAYYVNRILKGERPADLPVEFPTKLELVINLATARAIGLTVPPSLLARADEVIE